MELSTASFSAFDFGSGRRRWLDFAGPCDSASHEPAQACGQASKCLLALHGGGHRTSQGMNYKSWTRAGYRGTGADRPRELGRTMRSGEGDILWTSVSALRALGDGLPNATSVYPWTRPAERLSLLAPSLLRALAERMHIIVLHYSLRDAQRV